MATARKTKTQLRAAKVTQCLYTTGDWMLFLLELNEDLWDLRQSRGRKWTYLEHVHKYLVDLGVIHEV